MNKFKKIGIAISLGFAMLGGIWLASPSQAAGCNSFNVVYCGTHSMSELQTAYSRTEIKELYKQWYITETMVQGGSNMREGVVDANGNITVDGRVVATNAITVQSKAGTRQPQPQRSYKTSNGYSYYQYTTGQSFVDGPKSYKMYAWFDNSALRQLPRVAHLSPATHTTSVITTSRQLTHQKFNTLTQKKATTKLL